MQFRAANVVGIGDFLKWVAGFIGALTRSRRCGCWSPRLAAILRRPRHVPKRHDKLALAVGAAARRHLVGEDAREQRQIAGSVMPGAKPVADRGLTLGEAVGLAMGAGIAGASRRVHNRALVTIPREGSISNETHRAGLTALAGLMALALPSAIASSGLADAALVDLGALAQCDAQETLCPDDDLAPREQINGIVATKDRQPASGAMSPPS